MHIACFSLPHLFPLHPLQTLQSVFLASVAVFVFVYLVLGRWNYLMSQTDEEPMLDGIYRFPSSAHLPNLARGHTKLSQQEARIE